jgi:uridine kinase
MKKRIVIGISGGSGSGKSRFVNNLAGRFSKKELSVISMDNYYNPRETQSYDKNGIQNFDLPGSLDSKAFAKDLKLLIKGKEVEKKEYVFNNAKKKPKMLRFTPAPIILVEGLFVFHYKAVAKLLDYKLFIEAGDDLKVIRRIKRDGVERNYPMDDVIYRYAEHVSPSYKSFIEPYKETADIVVNNFKDFEKGMEIIEGFVRSRLKSL